MKKQASKLLIISPDPFISLSSPDHWDHSPELIFHIMKSRDQSSVLLFVISLLVAKSHLIVVIDDLVHVFVLLLCFGRSSHLGSLKWPEKNKKKRQFLALFWNFRLFHKTYHGIWRKHFSFYYRQSVPNLWNNSGFSMPYNLHGIGGGLPQFHPPCK